MDDQRERDRSVHVPEQTSLSDRTHTSPISQTTNLLGYKKTCQKVITSHRRCQDVVQTSQSQKHLVSKTS
jgi:hypothetical protein